ncbi:helix-turn-helix domain-containing protein [Nostoc sp.]|uniref:helix-turn-helix domain-containing protein n=1 Tax=Nostoc sp. TaxID=1180 RepID=UPI003FA557D3
MPKIFKAKIYPTNEQKNYISQILGCKLPTLTRLGAKKSLVKGRQTDATMY